MARGTTLENLILMFRAETKQSLSAAQGLNTVDAVKFSLRRVQEQLYGDFDWPHLRVTRDEVLQAGQRYYSFPADLNFDRIESVVYQEFGVTRRWREVSYGIGPVEYNSYDSDADERSDPVRRWSAYEGDQYEVWPLPAVNGGTLRFTGIKALPPLTDPQDVAALDDNMIVMFAAADWLEANKSPHAATKRRDAQAQYMRMRGNSQKNRVVRINSSNDRGPAAPGIRIRAPGT